MMRISRSEQDPTHWHINIEKCGSYWEEKVGGEGGNFGENILDAVGRGISKRIW